MQPDLYQYIPPNDITAPRHAAIRAAESACRSTLREVGEPYTDISALCVDAVPRPTPADFARISAACRDFAAAITAIAPRSADLTTAERNIREARMLANEAIAVRDVSVDTPRRLLTLAIDKLTTARMWSCAAVALAEAGELPAWES